MIYGHAGKFPVIETSAFVAENATVVGDVQLGAAVSVWYSAVVRGDIAPVTIGDNSNVQDGAVIHVGHQAPCYIGKAVTIGHAVILHACHIADNCLIGMGATILDNVEIGEGSIVGAASLVTQGKKFPPRSLIFGNPAKLVREITEAEYQSILENAREYIALARDTQQAL